VTSATAATVNGLLPILNKAELRDLLARVTVLLGPNTGDVGRFHAALVSVFPKSERVPPAGVMAGKCKSFTSDVLNLEAFVQRRMKPGHPTLHRKAVCIVLRALCDLIESEGHPATPMTVARHVGRYREAVEAAFPGYAESGMLGMLLKYDNPTQ